MTRYSIKIEADNAAFGETDYDQQVEVARILRELADRLEADDVSEGLRDSNGNRVGTFRISQG